MNFKNKLKKSGGFTLIEMLIVVAIIAILVAVSIPMVTSNLNDAKIATDKANERAAKAAANIEYMTAETPIADNTVFNYDADKGELVEEGEIPAGYGKCSEHKGGYITMTFDLATESFEMAWAGVPSSGGETTPHEIND